MTKQQFIHRDLQKMHKLLKLTVLEAGKLIEDRMNSPISASVERKAAFDYVTSVDHECERLIVSRIRKHYPDHAIMAEEKSSIEEKLGDGITWIIDPLDGTTNFIHRFPFVAISAAVAFEGAVVLGIVYDVVRKELFEAVLGKGAKVNDQPIRISQAKSVSQSLLATGFPFRDRHLLRPYLRTFEKLFLQVSGIRRSGSAALDLAYVAAGRVDGFWEIGLKPWDIAAGMVLINEAGGIVTDFWGKEDVLTTGHIVAGSRIIHPLILKEVQSHLLPHLDALPNPPPRVR